MVTELPHGGLTSVEQSLVEHVGRGEWLDLAARDEAVDEAALTTDVNLELKDCLLEGGILARGARLACVGLTGCRLEHPGEPPLAVHRLTCSVLALTGATITGGTGAGAVSLRGGAVRLTGAHIDGSLLCDGANLRNDSGPALVADVLQVDQDVECDRLTADGGVVIGGHIGRLLSLEGATLNNPAGIALSSDGLRDRRHHVLPQGLHRTRRGPASGSAV